MPNRVVRESFCKKVRFGHGGARKGGCCVDLWRVFWSRDFSWGAYVPALLPCSLASMALAEEPPGELAVPGFFTLAASTPLRVPLDRGGSAGLQRRSESFYI